MITYIYIPCSVAALPPLVSAASKAVLRTVNTLTASFTLTVCTAFPVQKSKITRLVASEVLLLTIVSSDQICFSKVCATKIPCEFENKTDYRY